MKIPIYFLKPDIPCINIEIEGRKFLCELDSCGDFYFSLKEELLNSIKNKKLNIGTLTTHDIKGNKYIRPMSSLNFVQIEKIWFKDVAVVEESMEFLAEGSILKPPICGLIKKSLTEIAGRVGASFFRANDYWLIDFPHASLYAIKDIDEFKKAEGSHFAGFVEVPLEWVDSFLVIPVMTDLGMKKLALDTGASHTVLRQSEQLVFNSREFTIGDHNFGEIQLHSFSIDSFFEFDGFLGRDFLREHAVYLDLKRMKAFIVP